MKRGAACQSRPDATSAPASSQQQQQQRNLAPSEPVPSHGIQTLTSSSGVTPFSSVASNLQRASNILSPVVASHSQQPQTLQLYVPSGYEAVTAQPTSVSQNQTQQVHAQALNVQQHISLAVTGGGTPGQSHPITVPVAPISSGAGPSVTLYSSRVGHRLITAPPQITYSTPTSVLSGKPGSEPGSVGSMQSTLQYQTQYSTPSATSRQQSAATNAPQQAYVTTKANQQILQTVGNIQVRHKQQVHSTTSPPATPLLQTVTTSPQSNVQNVSSAISHASNQSLPAIAHAANVMAHGSIVVHAPKQTTVSHGMAIHHVNSMGAHQQTQQNTSPQTQQSPNTSFHRLKVEDALSYLDKVKYKFGDQPQVYNDFLDIMKEFKSQSIDTPGVIARVSNLFKGHPELIEGFNTFLPPGYKIEVKANDQGYAYQVSVSMPSPTQSTTSMVHTPGPGQSGLTSPPMSVAQPPTASQPSGAVQPQSTTGGSKQPVMQIIQSSGSIIHTTMASQPVPVTAQGPPTALPQSSPVHSSSTPNIHHSAYASGINAVGNIQHSNNNLHHSISQAQAHQAVSQALSQVETGGHPTQQNQPVEFNHAINYVNKIKNRFQRQPEKYKKFLEILHTYQKEQKTLKDANTGSGHASSHGSGASTPLLNQGGPGAGVGGGANKHLTEAEVYSQVAKLFENQDDLLAEFGQFLPDATNHPTGLCSEPPTNDTSAHVAKKTSMKPSPYNNSNIRGDRDRERERERERENRERDHRDREHRETVERERDFREREREHRERDRERTITSSSQKYGHNSGHIKRSPPTYLPAQNISSVHHRSSNDGGPPLKKHKITSCRDVTLAEAGKYGSLNDYAFFDKVRKALRSQEVYDNFLRCLVLFNQEIISKSELVQLAGPFLGKFPELFKWFKDFLGHSDTGVEPIPNNVVRQERPQGDNALEVDLTTCKRLGASYCALPRSHAEATYAPQVPHHAGAPQAPSRRCSGRTALCREVLNDTWVSFPTWSEDSTFVTNRKTQFEEYIYRCEDERFELDVVIETNASTIRVLEGVLRRMQRMSPDEIHKFRLDDTLGGSSSVLHQRALRRIYGDKSTDIVDGLKRNPYVAVPVVLRRLKAKEDEWREAQKGFNKIWREQNEKYYLKSLDHQGINFKQNDVKALRSKSLFNEIETLYDERHEQNEEGASSAVNAAAASGPHLALCYAANLTPNSSASGVLPGSNGAAPHSGPIERVVLDDAANLLVHHVRRQTGIQKQEKARIKALLLQFIPDLFHHPRQQLSDDEREDDDKDDEDNEASPSSGDSKNKSGGASPANRKSPTPAASGEGKGHQSPDTTTEPMNVDIKKELDVDSIKVEEDEKLPLHALTEDPDECYTLFMANNNWYLFLRLHATLCSRLATIHAHAKRLLEEERAERQKRKQSTALALRLKPQQDVEVEEYYPAFLDMVKNLLDGNMDANLYEDTLREMFGIHAYVAFTLDKVLSYAVRQLQHCVTERGAIECCNLWLSERRKANPNAQNHGRRDTFKDKDFFRNLSRETYRPSSSCPPNNNSGAGGPCGSAHRRRVAETAYQRAAETRLRDENCFKIYIYKNSLRVTIELLDTETDDTNPQVALTEAQKWTSYVDRYATDLPSAQTENKPAATTGSEVTASTMETVSNMEIETVEQTEEKSSSGVGRRKFDLNSLDIKEEKMGSDDDNDHTVETMLPTWSGRRPCFLMRQLRKYYRQHSLTSITSLTTNAKQAGAASETRAERQTEDDDEANSVGDDLERKLAGKGPPERVNVSAAQVNSDCAVDDRAECRFNVNSYKMVFIVNKETILYKKDAIGRAKQCHPTVTKRMSAKLRSWHKKWLSANVTDTQRKQTHDWLMGRGDNVVPNRTKVIPNNDLKRTPYAHFNRYHVERLPIDDSV